MRTQTITSNQQLQSLPQLLRRILALAYRQATKRLSIFGLFLVQLLFLFSPALAAEAPQQWTLSVGEMRVVQFDEVARVAVGDGHVLNAVAAENQEVLVFAKNVGHSSLHIWTADGTRYAYHIQVDAPARLDALQELKRILQRIPQLNYTQIGSKIVVEGEQLSNYQRQQLLVLKQQYPQLLDFTYPIGWEAMVLLDVLVVEVPKNALFDLGLRWGDAAQGGFAAGLAWDTGSRKIIERPGETVVPMPFMPNHAAGYFGVNALLLARLHALKQSGEAVVLAQPQLLARSGATAEFLAGGEVPYSALDSQGNPQTQFKPYGVSLKITPHVEPDGAVRSFLDIEVSTIDNSVSTPAGPALKSRRASTEFNIRSGQTLVVAGFISREHSAQIDSVPGLSSVPILGALFQSKRFIRNETELAFFVTPTLIEPHHPVIEQRVQRSMALSNHFFPDANVLNIDIPTLPSAARIATDAAEVAKTIQVDSSAATRDTGTTYWNPYFGMGSQWEPQVQTFAISGG